MEEAKKPPPFIQVPAPERPAPSGDVDSSQQEEKRDAGAMLMTGAAIGVLGLVSAAIGGAVCPVCVVAAPALLGIGAYKRWRVKHPPKA